MRNIIEKTCGNIGCHNRATVVIDHPDHGERTVCDDHADDYDILRDLDR